MVRFLHTADWQMGMRGGHVGAAGQTVREARLATARRVVELAKEHRVDFLVLAGDTFEDNAVDRVLVQKVADVLGSFPGPVFLLPGNHDPLVPGSVWELPAWRSHGNLVVLREEAPVERDGVRLFPCPVREKYSAADPTAWIDARSCSEVAIGVAHGSVEGAPLDDAELPIPRDASARRGLDYLALGHWHSTATYPDNDGVVRMAYSGTHEPTGFDERDSGNVLLVEVAERGGPVTVTPLRTGRLRWVAVEENLQAPGDLRTLRERIESDQQAGQTLLRLQLSGLLFAEEENELQRIAELLEARYLFAELDTSRLAPSPEDDDWVNAVPPGTLRSVAERLRRLANPSELDRPEGATPQVAVQALLELYRLLREG